ncbi:hypothetical protein [Dactylosporangium sp. CA-092794]|uniref:hypothetical protein n=1 Tax=Dactylosporangium sp. CA-092794 TaxID=3239929 RepID=UPI003D8F7C2A
MADPSDWRNLNWSATTADLARPPTYAQMLKIPPPADEGHTDFAHYSIEQAYAAIQLESDGAAYGAALVWGRIRGYIDSVVEDMINRGNAMEPSWSPAKSMAAATFFSKIAAALMSLREWSQHASGNATALRALGDVIRDARDTVDPAKGIPALYTQYKQRMLAIITEYDTNLAKMREAQRTSSLATGTYRTDAEIDTLEARQFLDLTNAKKDATRNYYSQQAAIIMNRVADAYTTAREEVAAGFVYQGPTAAAEPASVLLHDLLPKLGLGGAGGGGLGRPQPIALAQPPVAAGLSGFILREPPPIPLAQPPGAANPNAPTLGAPSPIPLAQPPGAASPNAPTLGAPSPIPLAQPPGAASPNAPTLGAPSPIPLAQPPGAASLNAPALGAPSSIPLAQPPGAAGVPRLGAPAGFGNIDSGAGAGLPPRAGIPSLGRPASPGGIGSTGGLVRPGSPGGGVPGMGGRPANGMLRGRGGPPGGGAPAGGRPGTPGQPGAGGRPPGSGQPGRGDRSTTGGDHTLDLAARDEYIGAPPAPPGPLIGRLGGVPAGPSGVPPAGLPGRGAPGAGSGRPPLAGVGRSRHAESELRGRRARIEAAMTEEELLLPELLSTPDLTGRNGLAAIKAEIAAAAPPGRALVGEAPADPAAGKPGRPAQGRGPARTTRPSTEPGRAEPGPAAEAAQSAAAVDEEIFTVETRETNAIEAPVAQVVQAPGSAIVRG